MNITSSQLENVKELGNISAVSSYGAGFLTAIVSCFADLFGFSNTLLADKYAKANKEAVGLLINDAKRLNADGIMNFRLQIYNKTVVVYGTAYVSVTNTYSDALPEL